MPRSVPEWIGKTDDSPVPDRVKRRVFLKYGTKCQCGCGWLISPADAWDLDHIKALVNGGANRESNLWPLITPHHKTKTKADVAEKAYVQRRQMRHFGIKKRASGRKFLTNKDGPFKKKISGEVVRRR